MKPLRKLRHALRRWANREYLWDKRSTRYGAGRRETQRRLHLAQAAAWRALGRHVTRFDLEFAVCAKRYLPF